jgi:hypothetical protein
MCSCACALASCGYSSNALFILDHTQVQGCEPARLAMLGTTALPRLVALSNAAPASLLAQREWSGRCVYVFVFVFVCVKALTLGLAGP